MVRIPIAASLPSLTEVLTKEEDLQSFAISHPKHVPLWSNPLKEEKEEEHAEPQSYHGTPLANDAQKQLQGTVDSAGSSLKPEQALDSAGYMSHHEKHLDPEEPVLKPAHESTVIQLFYDLFFVANLTAFTSKHEVDNASTLKSYVAFFCILWFTWLQVALFDVRFGHDSAFERLCKLLQFGVMTGFAVIGPGFDFDKDSSETFKTLSLILMASRFILAGQYSVALFWLKSYHKARIPMILNIATELIAAFVFLGLYFAFQNEEGNKATTGWYVMVGFEIAAILGLAAWKNFLSFRRTAIVERLGLLTLIILGEGVIGLSESIGKVLEQESGAWTPDIIGQVISAVVILYFLWMLYFDQIETQRVGTVRQQIWIMLHLPTHVAILLVVEGIAQLTVWRKYLDSLNLFGDALQDLPNTDDAEVIVDYLNETAYSVYEAYPESEFELPDLTRYFDSISQNFTYDNVQENVAEISTQLFEWLGLTFEVAVPESVFEDEENAGNAYFRASLATYVTVFFYLFIAAGLVLILLAALFWIGKRRKSKGEFLSIGTRIVVGVGLALLAIMGKNLEDFLDPDSPVDSGSGLNFFASAWMLPTVCLAYGIVILLDNLLVNFVREALRRKNSTASLDKS
ncbi:hypothetical protein MMC25_006520 [Agyrium rufum]|nr:hypothetical protein [Agyrium rufum]